LTSFVPAPRLLVSVRDVAEARAAAAGGADIIDFKDPARGPLGRADFEVISAAASALQKDERPLRTPLSAALGEVREIPDWIDACHRHLPAPMKWLKLGLSGMAKSADWVDEWLQARFAIEQRLTQPVRWVAVAYADVAAAMSPSIDAVLAAAAHTGCAGLLIDTYDKSGGRLLEHLGQEQLRQISRRVHNRGLFYAVAGRLRASDLASLREVGADIIAVRSAACAEDDRQTAVDQYRVALLRQQIRALFGNSERGAQESINPLRASTPTPTAPAAGSEG
jgi:(5-formylfuran-3-yl)methyl phosphate synthase